nr:unnamed protein product [Papilio xuthus]
MAHDDLSSWLKVVAENKLTMKNTWKSTLIDHFTDIRQFKEMQGINFQKASCTLDGCVKVYSTRVDDISEEALKLLEGFSLEDETKKKSTKRKDTKTIEKNLANINIKTNSNPLFRDPLFTTLTKKSEATLLLSTLEIGPDGIFRLCLSESPRDLLYCNQEIRLHSVENKLISPNLNKLEDMKDGIPQLEESNKQEEENNLEEIEDFLEDLVFDGSIGEECEMVQTKTPVYKETPFSYFKGWGGPSQWKIRSRKAPSQLPLKSKEKVKEKFFIDFKEEIDPNKITEIGLSTLFDQDEIQKRKEKIHNLPEDFNFELDDLYKFNLLEKKFKEEVNVIQQDNNISLILDNPLQPMEDNPLQPLEEPIDETFIDLQKENVLLPYKPEQKKIDIKKLKENIFSTIQKSETVRLTEIYKEIPKMYTEKEGNNISIHFCIVSLLHLAHENDFELEETENDIIVCRR